MTDYREDLATQTNDIERKLDNLMGQMRRVNKAISDAITDEMANARISEKSSALMEERTNIWAQIKQAKLEKDSLVEAKRALLSKAGIDPRKLPAGLDELPISAEEWGIRLHGIKSPVREQLTEKLESIGMIAPRRQPISVWGMS